jgi:hypothetical protein
MMTFVKVIEAGSLLAAARELKLSRTVEAVTAAIGQLLDLYTPQECANYLKNAGYAST